jgi:hypothetical protein
VGVDVVPDLIAYNRSRFGGPQVEFRCANLIDDELPDGDLCMIRQVLQHLTNAEILSVLAKCAKYRDVLVTEEVFTKRGSRPNLEITHGPDNRASDKSGVFLHLPPFGFKTTTILEIPVPGDESVLRTVRVEGLADIKSRELLKTGWCNRSFAIEPAVLAAYPCGRFQPQSFLFQPERVAQEPSG